MRKKLIKRGFTLVEALVVVILIAIGAALAFSFYDNVVVEGRERAAAARITDNARTISEAVGAYFLREGRNPSSIQDLVTSGDLKAIPQPLFAMETEISIVANAYAAATTGEYQLFFDNRYKQDGTPDGVDGYIDLTGISSLDICKALNKQNDLGKIVVTDEPKRLPATFTCTQGTYDPASGGCATTVTCPAGSSFNATVGKCTSSVTCSQGSYDQSSGECTSAPSCSQGAYNSTLKQCWVQPNCPSGMTYNSTLKQCSSLPTCSTGTYNSTSKMCESGGTSTYAANITKTGGVAFTTPYYKGNPDYTTGTNQRYNGNLFITNSGSLVIIGYGPANGVVLPGGLSIFTGTAPLPIKFMVGTGAGYRNIPTSSTGLTNPVTVYRDTDGGVDYPSVYQSNYRYSGSYAWVTMPVAGYLSGVSDANVGGTETYSCNAGDTLNGSTCTQNTVVQTAPTCANGTFTSQNNDCEAAPSCNGGWSFNSTNNACLGPANCGSGTLNTSTNTCQTAPGCANGTILDADTGACTATVSCANGTLNAQTSTCLSAATANCTEGTTFDANTQECVGGSTCPEPFDPAADKCYRAGTYCYDAGDGTYTFHYPFSVQ